MASAATAATPAAASAAAKTSTAAAAAASSSSTTTTPSVHEQIRQLDDARKLVLANVGHYPMIVQGILPILNPSSLPPLRRWGADFLAEAFAAPAMPLREKESLSLLVLESLKGMLENPHEDVFVLRSVLQAAASIYPLVLRWIIHNSYDADTWERIGAIKSRILRLWEAPSPSVQICCIKFAQRVVLAQTHAANPDHSPRDGLDVSLSLVPPNHPLLDPRHLEAEASGLLDRMLGVLQDNSSDALIVDATLNSLSVLVRTRPTTVNRTINAVLNFNPLKLASSGPLTPRTRVVAKSMEKTTRMLLLHLTKRDPNNAFAPRIQQYIERLVRSRAELLDDAGRKRGLADLQAAAYGDAKRQRLAAGGAGVPFAQQQQQQQQLQQLQPHGHLLQAIPPLAPGPTSLADIFALTTNAQLRTFNASHVPLELAAKISVTALARVDAQLLGRAVQGIRDRLAALEAAAATSTPLALLNPDTAPLDVAVDDDDDDYEPDFSAAEDAEQILNKLDHEAADSAMMTAAGAARMDAAASLALGAFKLPTAPRLTPEQAVKVGQATVARVFSVMQAGAEAAPAAPAPTQTPTTAVAKRTTGKAGLNRVAATTYDKDAWITILTRLATRSVSGLEGQGDADAGVDADADADADQKDEHKGKQPQPTRGLLSDKIRESLFRYVMEDFRKRIDVAVAWLCEEWYNDRLAREAGGGRLADGDGNGDGDGGHYDVWVVRVLDGFLPYLHSQDNKVLTRFLSEVPALSQPLLDRVKSLCRDPSMVPVVLTSLLYQLMMRPPARARTLDTMEAIWLEFEDARPMATKYLDKWRPGFVQAHSGAAADSRPDRAVQASS